MIARFRGLPAAALLAVLPAGPAPAQVTAIPSPADSGSSLPFVAAAPDGRTFLSWVERAGEKGHALKFSVLDGDEWSAPRTIAEGSGWFVNWADFPSIAVLPGGAIAAHWLERSGPDTYAYDVRISRSFDGGATWTPPLTPHRDSTQTEHGFVSLFPPPGAGAPGAFGAAWLDGREMAGGAGEGHGGGGHDAGHGGEAGAMTLRYASFDSAGGVADEALLDERVCECCQTSAAVAAGGPVVVYRDRLEGEIRDIGIVRWVDGAWTKPARLSRDGWKIDGCPVNGPAIDARGADVAVAWFTAANDSPRVRLAFSRDGGGSFSEPVVVDDGLPSGRTDVAVLPDGGAIVSWLERVGGAGEVRVRRIAPDGTRSPSVAVAPSGTARSSGFPRMAFSGGRIVIAWTGDGVRTATLPVP